MEIMLKNVVYEKNDINLIDNINYTFKSGSITSIIGKSGSGKTLLSYLIMGLLFPTSGNIYIGNKKVTKDNIVDIRNNIGYVFQNPEESFVGLTVEEEIRHNLKKHNYSVSRQERVILEAIQMVGLSEDVLSRNITKISSGEQEKVALASVLVLNPKILILDEPTINLDNKSVSQLIKLIKKINRDYQKTIIVISNDIDFVHRLSNNILLLDYGKEVTDTESNNLMRLNMEVPQILQFIAYVRKKKNIDLSFTTDMDDLVKDINKNV